MKTFVLAFILACSQVVGAQTTLERSVQIKTQVDALVASLSIPPPIDVPVGGNLQVVLDGAPAGAVVRLTPGASYGAVTLRTNNITLTTTATLPIGRIDPSNAALLPKLQNVLTAAGVHHVTLIGLEITNSGSDLVRLGDGSSAQNVLSQVPHDLLLDRCYIHGDASLGAKRGIALNSASTTIQNSYISDIKVVGQDSQAIAGWNGPGPYLITNNYLEGMTENVMFGGADASIPNLVPCDITVSNNSINKPLSMRGLGWQVKNLFELKNACRVEVFGNTLTGSWGEAQTGYAFVITPRNQDGHAPWSTVSAVNIHDNTIAHVAAVLDIQGTDAPNVSGIATAVTFQHNTATDVDPWLYAGNDKLFMVLNGPIDLVIDGNTVAGIHIGSELYFDVLPKSLRMKFTNNILPTSLYGIKGSGYASGLPSWNAYTDQGTVTGNTPAP